LSFFVLFFTVCFACYFLFPCASSPRPYFFSSFILAFFNEIQQCFLIEKECALAISYHTKKRKLP